MVAHGEGARVQGVVEARRRIAGHYAHAAQVGSEAFLEAATQGSGQGRARGAGRADVPLHAGVQGRAARGARRGRARAGLRLARRIYGTEPMAGLIARESVPGAEAQSDAEIDAHVRATAGTTQHPVGTCAMGTGPSTVVDPELRVHGIAGLRVVDASVMPDVPGGNTNGPTIMIAEKASDLIRGRSLPAAEGAAA